MRYGYWMPVFGGWLRNVQDEGMEASWEYSRQLAQRSEDIGYSLTLIAELFLNDIKGIDAPSLEAWSTAAALAAVTERLELMVAVRPTFHQPAILAKQAANIDRISNGRLSLNVVSSWWRDEARRYGVQFDEHDDRYARTEDWLKVLDGAWRSPRFSYEGRYYRTEDTILEPKPVSSPTRLRPTIYAGGESETAKSLIARSCDAYVMHGDPPERIAPKIADMRRRRADASAAAEAETGQALPPLTFGMAAYSIVRDTETKAREELQRITNVAPDSAGYGNYQDFVANSKLDQQLSLEDYSVSNRGLRAGLVGTPEQVAERVRDLEEVGVDLLLLQCSPQLEEMERFAAEVMPLVS
ncbi:MAG: LLM class flavin-dependent oxidoreductase [Anaerolineae bacterium]|nr:LLM class flavin-dependent oxidoreductase [Gemmatimonadaceae bacterium]